MVLSNVYDLIYLAASGVNQIIPDSTRIAGMDLEALYELASRHQLTAITAAALESAGIKQESFRQAKNNSIRKTILLDAERDKILKRLEEAHIWYTPLKGVILKDYYHGIGIRQMSDNDILFDSSKAQEVRSIMAELGFSVEHFGEGYHDDYQKAPVSNFEMHRLLFTKISGDRIFAYYRDVKERLIKDPGNGYGYHFSNEDFYIYMLAHMYKHYTHAGTGMRSLLDCYVFLKHFDGSLDMEYICGETEKLGIAAFESRIRSLSLHLFEGRSLNAEQEEMLLYIAQSGAYGTKTQEIKNKLSAFGGGVKGKRKYVLSRIFLPLQIVQHSYPFFYKYWIFLPVLPIYRVLRRWKNVKAEIKTLKKISSEK